MDNFYSDWLSLMGGGRRPPLDLSSTQTFYEGMNAVYTMAFGPMLTELRGIGEPYTGEYECLTPNLFSHYANLDYDTNLTWNSDIGNKWLDRKQAVDYARYCLSGQTTRYQQALLDDIDIWIGNGTGDYYSYPSNNAPMNQQWMPQAKRLGTIYPELSCFEGTDMHPWWTDTTYPDIQTGLRYTIYNGPYLPSNINRNWYCASWKALCNLVNTPKIPIGGSSQGWFWINPLYKYYGDESAFKVGNFIESQLSSFTDISAVVEAFDDAVCGGTIAWNTLPWSVCGLQIGNAYYRNDDAAATQGTAYFNAPLLEPLDQMRTFFGASSTFATAHLSAANMNYKMAQVFGSSSDFGMYTDELSVGTDIEHWSGANQSGTWPEWSFVSKPYRDAYNGLVEVALQNSLAGNICTPPLRLVAENFFAHQWLWNSFLNGRAGDDLSALQNTIAWTPFKFTRPHFYRHYEFIVGGEAHLEQEGGEWVMNLNQSYNLNSWSDFEWRPLEELAIYEPVLADLPMNTLKYHTSGSFGSTGDIDDRYPHGHTQVSCVFEIPIPLSVDNDTAVFDTTYDPSSGYTRQQWDEIVRVAKTMFPKTASWKQEQELSAVQEYYDQQSDYLNFRIYWDGEELDRIALEEASLSVDCWMMSWPTAVAVTWPYEISPWDDFNDGITATSAWTGTNPGPYDNFLSSFANTYWGLSGYGFGSGYPYFQSAGSFEDSSGTFDWAGSAYDIYGAMAGDISTSIVEKNGQTSAYYTPQQIQQISAMLSTVVDDFAVNGYTALANSASQIQAIQTQFPQLTCTITVDPQTGTELSTYTYDDNTWKRVIVNMNNKLAVYAEAWFNDSAGYLHSAYDYDPTYSEQTKWDKINAISAAIDPTLDASWHTEYAACLSSYTQYYAEERARLSADIEEAEDELADLEQWYQDELDRIAQIEDDPMPNADDLNRFLSYDLSPQADQLSSSWSASLNMLAVCPDTPSEPLADYPSGYDKLMEEDYYCDYPKTRWPVYDVSTEYMIPIMKTALEPVEVEGQTILSALTKGKVLTDLRTTECFDGFRQNLMGYMEAGIAGSYFGLDSVRPQPHQLWGTEVINPERWNISATLSVDVGDHSEGIWMIMPEGGTGYVKFGDERWEHLDILIYCSNGPVVNTDDCWFLAKTRWEQQTQISWHYVQGQGSQAEYYAKEPIAGEDYALPELSGNISVTAGPVVIGQMDTTEFMKDISGF